MKCDHCVHSLKKKTGVLACWLPRCVKDWEYKAMSDDAFYHSQRWRTLRNKALRRDKYLCVECKRYGRKVPANVVHHIKERADYPELQYDINNLECLCDSCHNKKHPDKGGYVKGQSRY